MRRRLFVTLTTLCSIGLLATAFASRRAEAAGPSIPKFEADPYWPKPLPNNWILGEVSGVAVDSRDHVWIIHRPRTTSEHDRYAADGKGDCCVPAPAVIEFDQAGNVVQAWGGPAPKGTEQGYEWPDNEHGIFVDAKDNVWVGGNGDKDAQILKFTPREIFFCKSDITAQSKGSNDPQNLGRPAGIVMWPATSEIFVADGYANRRVVVYDSETGAYKRHWGLTAIRPTMQLRGRASMTARGRLSST